MITMMILFQIGDCGLLSVFLNEKKKMNKRNLNPNESGNRVSYAPWFTFRLYT